MTYSIFCYSDSGAGLAQKLCGLLKLSPEHVHTTEKHVKDYGFTCHKSISGDMKELFSGSDALIFIGAAGIAVRTVAPYIVSKTSDPAVLVIDDRGRYVIPVLSGHIGGANELSREIARLIGAQAVVTTATDGAGKFSCDAWAVTHGCAISSMHLAKEVSAAVLTEDVPVCSEYALPEDLPAGLTAEKGGNLGVFIGVHKEEPYASTLRLIPRVVTLGIGCRKNIPLSGFMEAVHSVLDGSGIDLRAVGTIASIDVKKEEKGIIGLAKALNAETVFYSAEQLNAVPGEFEESEFVRKTVGTGNVCERAAVLAGGKLIIGKTAVNGVTVAVSVRDWRIEF